MPRFPVPLLHQLFPVAGHRLVVVDPGTRTLKLLVVERSLRRLRILHRQSLDLDEGPDAPSTVAEQLAAALPDLGPCRLALVLPQHRTISTILEVPPESAREPDPFIEAEVRKLSGLAEDAMFHGHVRLEPFGRFRNPHFVTLGKRTEIATLIDRFAPPVDGAPAESSTGELAEIVSTGQAMFAALQAGQTAPQHAVVVDLGADNTVVGIMVNGQGVHATSFEGGGQQFTAAIAQDQNCSLATAEMLKRTDDLLGQGPPPLHLARALSRWYAEVQRAVSEWMEDYPELGLGWNAMPAYLCGGAASQPGLLPHLNRLGALQFQPWPALPDVDPDLAMEQYRVAYGAACTTLARPGRVISLAPPEIDALRRRRRWWEYIQAANVVVLLLITLVLGLATWQKAALLRNKHKLIGQTTGTLASAEAVVQLAQRLEQGYTGLRPILARQQQSLETLRALAAVRAIRTNNDFWLVLFADAASYAAGSTLPPPAPTNPPPALLPGTNAFPPRREFIAELCIPQEGDATRNILSRVVADLKRASVFGRVDALPPERKRAVVDPRVAISNRVFAVSMEIGSNETSSALELLHRLSPGRDPRRNLLGPPPRTGGTNAVNP